MCRLSRSGMAGRARQVQAVRCLPAGVWQVQVAHRSPARLWQVIRCAVLQRGCSMSRQRVDLRLRSGRSDGVLSSSLGVAGPGSAFNSRLGVACQARQVQTARWPLAQAWQIQTAR